MFRSDFRPLARYLYFRYILRGTMKNQPSPSRTRSESNGGEHPGHICAEIWFLPSSRKWAMNKRHF